MGEEKCLGTQNQYGKRKKLFQSGQKEDAENVVRENSENNIPH
jgi:hypothetical protein